MQTKLALFLFSAVAAVFAGCSRSQEAELAALKAQVAEANAKVTALQTELTAIKKQRRSNEDEPNLALSKQLEAVDARIVKLEATVAAKPQAPAVPVPNNSNVGAQVELALMKIARLEEVLGAIIQRGAPVARPANPVAMTPTERNLVGVWQLTKGDKGDIQEMTVECTDEKTLKISGKGRDVFVIKGLFSADEKKFTVTLEVPGVAPITSTGQIKTLTATDFVLVDENGKIEEYKRLMP